MVSGGRKGAAAVAAAVKMAAVDTADATCPRHSQGLSQSLLGPEWLGQLDNGSGSALPWSSPASTPQSPGARPRGGAQNQRVNPGLTISMASPIKSGRVMDTTSMVEGVGITILGSSPTKGGTRGNTIAAAAAAAAAESSEPLGGLSDDGDDDGYDEHDQDDDARDDEEGDEEVAGTKAREGSETRQPSDAAGDTAPPVPQSPPPPTGTVVHLNPESRVKGLEI